MTTQMAPMSDVYVRQPYEHPQTSTTILATAHPVGYNQASMEAAEMAAFEKGRMQGEMEAIRRAEAQAPLKTMAPAQNVGVWNETAGVNTINQPDVIEINRLTWVQKACGVVGELSALGMIALTVAWLDRWREGFAWDNGQDNGEHRMLNAGILAFSLGLFFNAQAISNYRFLPLNMSANFNRAWFIAMEVLTGACYSVAFAAVIMTYPSGENTFWRVDNWVFAMAFLLWTVHMFYAVIRTVMDRVWPVDYETWAEVNNNLDNGLRPKHVGHARDGVVGNDHNNRRTIYTAAPVTLNRGNNLPAANANVGAQVPVAPANAPRWAENPRTHSEDYFLLPRSKIANIAFWSMGAAFLMLVAATQVLQAAGRGSWSTGNGVNEPTENDRLGFNSTEAHVIGALGLLTLATLVCISNASMPPRTTLVKNGIITEARRPSISQNAETIV